MKEHRPEVADVFRQHEEEFLERWRSVLSDRQLLTLRDIGACRTAVLGAHLYQCDGCHRLHLRNSRLALRSRMCFSCWRWCRATHVHGIAVPTGYSRHL